MLNFEIKTIEMPDGNKMKVTVFGMGDRKCVIIPGMSLTPVSDSAGAVVRLFSEYLEYYTFYMFDRKLNFADGYSVEDMAHDTAFAMGQLGISAACVYGTSQGGMIAQSMAIDYPELVCRLVIASSSSRSNKMIEAVFPYWSGLAENGNIEEMAIDMFRRIYSEKMFTENEKAFQMLAKSIDKSVCPCAKILSDACLNFDRYDELDKIKCPCFVLAGENDNVLSCAASVETAAKIGCECVVFPSGSHAVYDEVPGFVDIVMEFFGKY